MNDELRRIKRHNRIVLIVLAVLGTLLGISIYLTARAPKVSTIDNNYIGQKGDSGMVGQQGLSGSQGPQGVQGIQGVKGDTGATGTTGAVGVPGIQGPQGDQGPAGDKGEDGKTPEFRCAPNGNFQWRYVGDENWQNLQKNSAGCKSAL